MPRSRKSPHVPQRKSSHCHGRSVRHWSGAVPEVTRRTGICGYSGFVATGIFGVPILGQPISGIKPPPGALSADKAAAIILRGVAANREKIIFPAQPRVLDLLYRVAPPLLHRIFRAEAKKRLSG